MSTRSLPVSSEAAVRCRGNLDPLFVPTHLSPAMQVRHSVLSCFSMPMKLPIRASREEPPRRNRQLSLSGAAYQPVRIPGLAALPSHYTNTGSPVTVPTAFVSPTPSQSVACNPYTRDALHWVLLEHTAICHFLPDLRRPADRATRCIMCR
jgi:hypothetical protein